MDVSNFSKFTIIASLIISAAVFLPISLAENTEKVNFHKITITHSNWWGYKRFLFIEFPTIEIIDNTEKGSMDSITIKGDGKTIFYQSEEASCEDDFDKFTYSINPVTRRRKIKSID